ncbi:MAG: sigma-54 dependent transcriptional regulator [Bryobacteraceae bacterium]|nr:sigma-54 dependent transcriptional regulator [Bryobacteraceae bacterium]
MSPQSESLRVLVADDDEQDRKYMGAKIASWGYSTETAVDGLEAVEKAVVFQPHVIVSDLRMPRLDGFELIRKLNELGGSPPVIVLTQFGAIETAISAMHDAGAFWFLEKPVPLQALQVLIERAASQRKLSEENERLRIVLRTESCGDMVGNSPQMREVFSLIRRVAPSKATVLITGESGTGKELVARAIHANSPRADAPFVPVNCAALPDTLIESELFGHEKGAFTGAVERRLGRIELAHGGTLFLDEIGELPLQSQAKLLRVLEDSRVQRLGSKGEVQVDVRVLAATNRPPLKTVKEGKLREDLYYRLNVFHVELTPLRERKEDIPLLVEALLSSLRNKNSRGGWIEPGVVDKLTEYRWPGNVRELRNVLERAVILAGDGPISMSHLPSGFSAELAKSSEEPSVDAGKLTLTLGTSLHDAEKALILATLAYTNNSRRRTAEILGLSLKTIQIKLKEYRGEAGEPQASAVGEG